MRRSNGVLGGEYEWKPVRIGGLGFVTGWDCAADGSWMICWTDVGGCYRRFAAPDLGSGDPDYWQQIVDTRFMTVPPPTGRASGGAGTFAGAIAPSDPNVAYIAMRATILRTGNKGESWTDLDPNPPSGLYMNANGGNVRLRQHKLRVDPVNPNHMLFGSQQNGLWRYISGAITQVASVPVSPEAANGDKSLIIAFDPTSANTGAGATLRKSVVYVSVNGEGLYRSTDGAANFALMSPAPPNAGAGFRCRHMHVDATGTLWYLEEDGLSGNTWKFEGGVWTQIAGLSTRSVSTIETDPKNPNVVIANLNLGGGISQSLDHGASWATTINPPTQTAVAKHCTIAAQVLEETFRASLAASACYYKPHPVNDEIWVAGGYGTYRFEQPVPPSAPLSLVWYEDTAGIEELVAHQVRILPGGVACMNVHDRGLVIQNPDRNAHAVVNHPLETLTWGWNTDHAWDDPDFQVTRIIKGNLDDSAYSEDRGRTWTNLATRSTASNGGTVVCVDRNNIIMFPGQNAWPRHTANLGANWTDVVFAGYPRIPDGTASGFGFGTIDNRRHIAVVDKRNGHVYAYCYGGGATPTAGRGLWKSTDGGKNFSMILAGYIINSLYIGYHIGLHCAPNGDLYICPGPTGSDYDGSPSDQTMRSTDGGASFTAITQLYEITAMALGAPLPGAAVPYIIYAKGWKAGVFGHYWSHDRGDNWELMPSNSHFDFAVCLAADLEEFGRVIEGYSGSGYAERRYRSKIALRGS